MYTSPRSYCICMIRYVSVSPCSYACLRTYLLDGSQISWRPPRCTRNLKMPPSKPLVLEVHTYCGVLIDLSILLCVACARRCAAVLKASTMTLRRSLRLEQPQACVLMCGSVDPVHSSCRRVINLLASPPSVRQRGAYSSTNPHSARGGVWARLAAGSAAE